MWGGGEWALLYMTFERGLVSHFLAEERGGGEGLEHIFFNINLFLAPLSFIDNDRSPTKT